MFEFDHNSESENRTLQRGINGIKLYDALRLMHTMDNQEDRTHNFTMNDRSTLTVRTNRQNGRIQNGISEPKLTRKSKTVVLEKPDDPFEYAKKSY